MNQSLNPSACTDLCRESALKFTMLNCFSFIKTGKFVKVCCYSFFQWAINLDLVFMLKQFIGKGVRMQGASVTAKIWIYTTQY